MADWSPLEDFRNAPLFAVLPDDRLALLAAQAQRRAFRTREVIVQQGDTGQSLFVVAEGWVEVVYGRQAERGRGEVVLTTLGPGSVVGELAVLTDHPRLASVVALEPVRCYELPRAALTRLFEEDHAFLRAFLNLIADRLKVADGRIAEEGGDPLTGLPNRGILANAYRRAAAQIQRSGGKLSIVMLDIDGLRQINEQLGYSAGDRVIRSLADAMDRVLRRTDLVVRFGGDEFVIMLPGADSTGADVVVQRLRAFLDALNDLPAGVGFSAGRASVACAPREAPPPLRDVLQAAEEAMVSEKALKLGGWLPA